MNKKVVRTAIIYIVSLAVFACAFAQVNTFSANWRAALLFQLLVFFIINEVWYWLCTWPGVFLSLFQQIKNKNVPEQNRGKYVGGLNRLVRMTSVIILILPHVIYGTLWLVNLLSQHALQRWGGVSLDASLFLPSYLSCIVFFILVFIFPIQPYSISHFMMEWFEPGLGKEKVTEEKDDSSASSYTAPLNVRNEEYEGHSILFDAHYGRVMKEMVASEELLMMTAPIPYAFNRQTRMELMIGVPFILASAWVASMLFRVVPQSGYSFIFWALLLMLLVFFPMGCLLVFSPARWKKRLSRTDYFITSKRVFLAEENDLRQFLWKDEPYISLQMHHELLGSVYISRRTRVSACLDKLFGKGKVNAYETDETDKMNGLLNIPQAEKVYAMIESLMEHSKEP